MFPLRFILWKQRMLFNALKGRREYLALGVAAGLVGGAGSVALVRSLGEGLAELYTRGGDALLRTLSLFAFALYLALLFMALANIVTRFFGAERLDERMQLMGPLSPRTLFMVEVLDTYRLPLIFVTILCLLPVLAGALAMGLPVWVIVSIWLTAALIYLQPVLLVMALSIGVVGLLPRALLGRQRLLFGVMLAAALVGLGGLDALRTLLEGRLPQWQILLPTAPLAYILPALKGGDLRPALAAPLIALGIDLALGLAAIGLYTHRLLGDLDRFRVATSGEAALPGARDRLFEILARAVGGPEAALVIKDLRSSRRDTAQRVAFTLLAAMMTALVLGDLIGGRRLSALFIPIFFAYALFLVSCQGLSTFSAEGGVLHNLARLPLSAGALLRAKWLSHFLLFLGVLALSVCLGGLAPSQLPFFYQIPLVLVGGALFVPVAALLAFLTVTLGAIFPKPGEGGNQRSISIFAMGIFLHFLSLMAVSAGVGIAALGLGPAYGVVALALAALWAGILSMLWGFARRAVERAMGGGGMSGAET